MLRRVGVMGWNRTHRFGTRGSRAKSQDASLGASLDPLGGFAAAGPLLWLYGLRDDGGSEGGS